uniref:NADH-ubiquinone oxidoreductase chain 4L n=1 Tax=Trialeurodes vaporariorum TaxID=88556 RepID=Q674N1_TRIVP|nr:NADH dehydrogenase subunit 4L [Trialeurodes vaporariorum]AAU14229.1 NADH dehydrogenase subunit 4L [Trialeurodes vaporariorum]
MSTNELQWVGIMIMIFSYTLVFNKTHIMNSLIILECMTILVILMMFTFTMKMKMENMVIMYLIIISLSESIIGMTILISMIRTHSNDYIISPNAVKL